MTVAWYIPCYKEAHTLHRQQHVSIVFFRPPCSSLMVIHVGGLPSEKQMCSHCVLDLQIYARAQRHGMIQDSSVQTAVPALVLGLKEPSRSKYFSHT